MALFRSKFTNGQNGIYKLLHKHFVHYTRVQKQTSAINKLVMDTDLDNLIHGP